MKFIETKLKGAYLIEPDVLEDERGFFARCWDTEEFSAQGLESTLVQCSISFNKSKGTLRGLHFQASPHEEAKLIRCTRGLIFDVIVDIRPASPTFKKWVGIELSGENHKSVFAPRGFAHGFQTLTDNCEIFYQMSEFYKPEWGQGIRWNDPALNIKWPLPHPILSTRDQNFPDFGS